MKVSALVICAVLLISETCAQTCSFDLKMYTNSDCTGTETWQKWANVPIGLDETATAAEINGVTNYVKIVLCDKDVSVNMIWFSDAAGTTPTNGV